VRNRALPLPFLLTSFSLIFPPIVSDVEQYFRGYTEVFSPLLLFGVVFVCVQ
jgi:hypothetical protein